MNQRDSVIVLGGGIDSIGIIERVIEAGFTPIVVDWDSKCPARRLTRFFVNASCYDPERALSGLLAMSYLTYKQDGVLLDYRAILGGGTDAVEALAFIGEYFGLVAPRRRTAALCANKFDMKMRLLLSGVRVPAFWKAREPGTEAPRDKAIVFKPIRGRGTRGVVRVRPGETDWPAMQIAAKAAGDNGVMGEIWIDGIQLSSESLVQDGHILWTAFAERNYGRLDEFAPHIIEDGSDMPPQITQYHERDYSVAANEQLQLAVNAIGLHNGTLKGDLVWDGGQAWIIEIAPRLSGGGFCSDLIPACWNVDFVGYALRIALGEDILPGEIRPWLKAHVCQRYSFPKRPVDHTERGGWVLGVARSRDAARRSAEMQLNGK